MTMNKKRNESKIIDLFENVYPVRCRIMVHSTATSLSTFCYASGIQLTDREKDEFLKPIRDIPMQEDWIRTEVGKGTRISIIGKDVLAWLTRIRNPKEYWDMFKDNPMLHIWIIARRGIKEINEINSEVRSIMRSIDRSTVPDQELQQEFDRIADLNRKLNNYRKMMMSDPMPTGTFMEAEVYNFMHRSMTEGTIGATTLPNDWLVSRDAIDNRIEIFYKDFKMEMNKYVAGPSSFIIERYVYEPGVGHISLSKNVSKFSYIIPTTVMPGVSNLPEFDVAFPVLYKTKSGNENRRHIVVRVGS
jgi:hypothetical protein